MLKSKSVLLLLIACFINVPAFAQRQDIGMVLMHGKQGVPKNISELAGELRKNGYVVLTPLMPWGWSRINDVGVEEAMLEIDRHTELLRKKGAKRVFVAGQSRYVTIQASHADVPVAAAREVVSWLESLE